MHDDLERDIEATRRDRPLRIALHGAQTLCGRWVTWAFVLASACHLWLADAWQLEWLPANLIYLAGLALLITRRAALGWLVSAVGLAIPLLFHRDQLTQSLLLLLWSTVAGVGLMVDGWRSTDPGRATGTPCEHPHNLPGEWVFLKTARGLAVLTYLFAVLHKLNREFFDTRYSCAVYGVEELAVYWRMPVELIPAWLVDASPWLVLGAEGGIALLYLLRRRRAAWLLMAAFHIPLTLTMAPAFVFVMLVGHAAFVRPRDAVRLREVLLGHGYLLATAAAALTAASLWLHGAWPEWTMIPREFLLWGLLLTLLVAFPPWTRAGWQGLEEADRPDLPRLGRAAVAAVLAGFLLNGLTPYLGVQFQHTAAMVSNLRIDRGCWNSLVFPESMRLTDDYIRVEQAYFGRPGRIPDYEAIVLDRLWSPPQLRQMRRNWCGPEVRPFYMRGTFRDRQWVIEDLCAGEPLPFPDAGVFGVEVFGDYLRFQKKLERQCPQACIH